MWKIILTERVKTRDGRVEDLHVMTGPIEMSPAFYVGPASQWQGTWPRFNQTEFYHHTHEEALTALIEMAEDLKGNR